MQNDRNPRKPWAAVTQGDNAYTIRIDMDHEQALKLLRILSEKLSFIDAAPVYQLMFGLTEELGNPVYKTEAVS